MLIRNPEGLFDVEEIKRKYILSKSQKGNIFLHIRSKKYFCVPIVDKKAAEPIYQEIYTLTTNRHRFDFRGGDLEKLFPFCLMGDFIWDKDFNYWRTLPGQFTYLVNSWHSTRRYRKISQSIRNTYALIWEEDRLILGRCVNLPADIENEVQIRGDIANWKEIIPSVCNMSTYHGLPVEILQLKKMPFKIGLEEGYFYVSKEKLLFPQYQYKKFANIVRENGKTVLGHFIARIEIDGELSNSLFDSDCKNRFLYREISGNLGFYLVKRKNFYLAKERVRMWQGNKWVEV